MLWDVYGTETQPSKKRFKVSNHSIGKYPHFYINIFEGFFETRLAKQDSIS